MPLCYYRIPRTFIPIPAPASPSTAPSPREADPVPDQCGNDSLIFGCHSYLDSIFNRYFNKHDACHMKTMGLLRNTSINKTNATLTYIYILQRDKSCPSEGYDRRKCPIMGQGVAGKAGGGGRGDAGYRGSLIGPMVWCGSPSPFTGSPRPRKSNWTCRGVFARSCMEISSPADALSLYWMLDMMDMTEAAQKMKEERKRVLSEMFHDRSAISRLFGMKLHLRETAPLWSIPTTQN